MLLVPKFINKEVKAALNSSFFPAYPGSSQSSQGCSPYCKDVEVVSREVRKLALWNTQSEKVSQQWKGNLATLALWYLLCPFLRNGSSGEGLGGHGVWLRLDLVLFPFGGLGCLLPLRRPPEASGLESQVIKPPLRDLEVPWGPSQPLAHLPMQIRYGNLQLDN